MPVSMARDGAQRAAQTPSLAMVFSFAAAAVGIPCRKDGIKPIGVQP
jgi:hypothetical protein